ncbi:MAG TPA: universal stress protein [Blastocatellia bacterium]|nr:universal stress protein [Blastocatellia bacterium]
MNILIAVDSSSASKAAVEQVVLRPWPKPVRTCILSVIDPEDRPGWLLRMSNEAAEGVVKAAADTLASRGLETASAIIHGHPRTSIVEYAESWGADLIVVGSHGESGIGRFHLGSVAQAVVRRAHCSVEVARPDRLLAAHPGEKMRILLATDGSTCSAAAAQSVARRPWPAGTEVKILNAFRSAVSGLESWFNTPEAIARLQEEDLNKGEAATVAAQKILEGSGLVTDRTVLMGDPKAIIIDEAGTWGADLIAVGSHGRRGVTRLLLGSVAEAVAMHAHCSVEVIRAAAS